jgi:hypothetical protein
VGGVCWGGAGHEARYVLGRCDTRRRRRMSVSQIEWYM